MTLPPLEFRRSFAANVLAGGLTVLPLLQSVPFDLDRQASLMIGIVPLLALWPEVTAMIDASLRSSRWRAALACAAIVAILVSTLHSAHPAPALVTVASWASYSAIALVVSVLGASNQHRKVLTGIAAGGVVGAALLLANWLGHHDPRNASWMELVAPYAHYRHVGLHLFSAALASVALAVDMWSSPIRRLLAVGAGTIVWTALLWSGSRAPLLGLGVGALVIIWLNPRHQALRIVGLCAVFAVAGLSLSLLFPSRELALGWRHASVRTFAVANVQEASSNRTELWSSAAEHVLERPWFGSGPDGYRFLTPKMDGQQPHNLLLQLLLDSGTLGTIVTLALLVSLVFRPKSWRAAKLGADERAGLIAAGAGIFAAALATAQLDGVFYHAVAALPAFAALGLFCAQREEPATGSGSVASRRAVTWLGATIVAGACCIQFLHSLVFSLLASPPAALPSNGWDTRLVRAFPSTLYGLPNWLDTWEPQSPRTALEWTFWAQKQAPNAFLYHIRAAVALARQGGFSEALIQIESARETAPKTAQGTIDELEGAIRRASEGALKD